MSAEDTEPRAPHANDGAIEPNAMEKRPWGGLAIGVIVLLCLIMETYDSRWYYEAYFYPPREISLLALRDAQPDAVFHKRLTVRWRSARDTGVIEEETTRNSQTSEILDRQEIAQYRLLKGPGRGIIAKIATTHTGLDYDGVILPVPSNIRHLVTQGKPAQFEKSYCPFYIDTVCLSATRTYSGITARLLIGLTCLLYIARWLKWYGRSTRRVGLREDSPAKTPNSLPRATPFYTKYWRIRIDEDRLQWQVDHWKWLIRELQKNHDIKRIRLVLPTPADFPVTHSIVEQTASDTFRCVKTHFGIDAWPATLKPFKKANDMLEQVAPLLSRSTERHSAAGLFEVTERREVVIHYKPEQVKEPLAMVATMAHELCHYILVTIPGEPPGGWSEHEPLTDLTAVFFGFGIFLANASFRFAQWQDSQYHGWSTRTLGYLSDYDLSLALAIFCAWKNIDPGIPSRSLSANPRHYLKKFHKELLKRYGATIQELRAASE